MKAEESTVLVNKNKQLQLIHLACIIVATSGIHHGASPKLDDCDDAAFLQVISIPNGNYPFLLDLCGRIQLGLFLYLLQSNKSIMSYLFVATAPFFLRRFVYHQVIGIIAKQNLIKDILGVISLVEPLSLSIVIHLHLRFARPCRVVHHHHLLPLHHCHPVDKSIITDAGIAISIIIITTLSNCTAGQEEVICRKRTLDIHMSSFSFLSAASSQRDLLPTLPLAFILGTCCPLHLLMCSLSRETREYGTIIFHFLLHGCLIIGV